ncbi:MAG TPA: UDP-N-acetylmuramoyl-L-alanyl-D-glutamate--2,6-diaminopimelate ligase [Armatimonadota bacterium]|jgi:UDP-N-acetylmuramoyl-L-alanyl-D-glutamate--2,6-diaminopimelate ligase
MTLGQLISDMPPGTLAPVGAPPRLDAQIDSIVYDSRQSAPGTVFVAMVGEKTDGHRFLPAAVEAGAVVVGEDEDALRGCGGVAFLTPNSRRAIAELACSLYSHPSREMDVIGVTGTNGKTTTVHLIERLYAGLGFSTGRIGTLGVKIGDIEEEGAHTTPEAPDLQRTLRRMADAGVKKVAMEVSSHALAQDRTWGIVFPTVVFTNLTQDHLDYHHDMEEYFAAKRRLFTEYELSEGAAVLNADDPYGRRLAENCSREISMYGVNDGAARATDVRLLPGGSEFTLQIGQRFQHVRLMLPGLFNVYNALAALTAVHSDASQDPERLPAVLETLTGAPGRFEAVDEGQDFAVLVDYAHTPDALENVLRAARKITPNGRVLAVFGCGGDRDRTKRPLMGHIAGELSDLAFVTSDNPRTEEPQAIVAEVVAGMAGQHNYAVDPDRRAAIHAAIAEAQAGDTVVIAGKGHEDYQILGTVKHHFDDREVAREALKLRRSQA